MTVYFYIKKCYILVSPLKKIKKIRIKNLVDEIKQMPNKLFILHDPHLTANPKYARSFFKELIRQKVNKGRIANGTANVLAKTGDDFLELARKSGCVEWFVDFDEDTPDAFDVTLEKLNEMDGYRCFGGEHSHSVSGNSFV